MSQSDHLQRRGPKSIAQLADWPHVAWARLLVHDEGDFERRHRLARLALHFQKGFEVTSDYSGVGPDHDILRSLAVAGEKFLHLPNDSFVAKLQFTRACDYGSPQQAILLARAKQEGGRMCVFNDLHDRLPHSTIAWLDAAMPGQCFDKLEAALAYGAMSEWLMRQRAHLFRPDTTSFCLAHNRSCKMYPHWFQAQRSALASSDGGASSAKRARPSLRRLDAFDSAVVDDAVAGDDETRDEGKLKAHLAAPTCTGWSSVGHQKHYGDATERPHGIWVAERKRLGEEAQEDVAFCENTPSYPVEQKLRQPLADTHEVFGITFSPVPMGWPTRRSRKLMACLNMRATAWVGPPLKDLHVSFANLLSARWR